MMRQFTTVPLRQLIEVGKGISYGIVQPGSHVDTGIPIVRVTDVKEGRINTETPLRVDQIIETNYARTRLRGGELLITVVGTPGQTAIVPANLAGWNVARAIAVLPIQADIGAYWVQLALQSPAVTALIDSRLNTTVQATLNLGDLAELPILLPPKSERDRIISVIGALDNKIELNRQMNETLEAMARAVFKDWFVDFGPTRAKMEGREPYLAPEIWSLFPDHLDDEGKPEGWKDARLGNIAAQAGRVVDPEDVAANTPYIGLEHMPRRSIALTDWSAAEEVSSGKLAFKAGDLLFGKLRPYFHKVGIAPVNGICSTDIAVLKGKREEYNSYIICCISQNEFVSYTDATSDGTKMPRTSWGRMETYGVWLSGQEILGAFHGTVSPLLERIVSNVHEGRSLAAIRDLLLPKLMSGEIRIKDAEKAVEGVA